MTFPGESLAVTGSGNVIGAPIGPGTITYRADSATFNTGDEAWVDVGLYPLLLAPGDDAEVSWVLEVIGGSGGLDLTEDAGSLGTHSVMAGDTLVVPSSLTAVDVLAGGTARLTIACPLGPVQVQQVKLRVWPVGGVVGGYSDPYTPPATSVPIAMRLVLDNSFSDGSEVLASGSDIDVVFQDTETVLAGGIGGKTVGDPGYFSTSTGIGAQFAATAQHEPTSSPPARGLGTIAASVAYIERSGDPFTPDPAGTFGVDWVYPPNEVPYDPDGWQFVGAPVWGWYQGVATIIVNTEAAGDPPGSFRVGADPVDGVDAPSTLFSTIFLGANIVGAILATPLLPEGEFDLPAMSDTGMLRLSFWHDGATPPPYMPATSTVVDAGKTTISTGDANANVHLGRYVDGVFYPVQASYQRSYRYWTLTPTVVRKLRQYHLDNGQGIAPRRSYGGTSRSNTGRRYGDF